MPSCLANMFFIEIVLSYGIRKSMSVRTVENNLKSVGLK